MVWGGGAGCGHEGEPAGTRAAQQRHTRPPPPHTPSSPPRPAPGHTGRCLRACERIGRIAQTQPGAFRGRPWLVLAANGGEVSSGGGGGMEVEEAMEVVVMVGTTLRSVGFSGNWASWSGGTH